MEAQAVIEETWPKRCHTKIVGTTFEGSQELLAGCRDQGIVNLELGSDPLNRYDPYAVAIEARINDESGKPTNIRLGFLSNSDRICSDCGTLVGGSMFERSRQLKCHDCGREFGYEDEIITHDGNGVPIIECPGCLTSVDLGLSKLVVCPNCGGNDFGRGGLATRFSRALAAGVRYSVCVMEYTGGDLAPSGKRKSLGCNIRIQRLDR